MAVEKPAVSRRLMLAGSGILMVALVLGALFSLALRNPSDIKAEKEEAERMAEIERQPAAEESELAAALAARESELERLKREEESRRRRAEIESAATELATGARDGRPSGRSVPDFDPALFAALEEADRKAGQRPGLTAGTGRNLNGGQVLSGGGDQSAASPPAVAGMFEGYASSPAGIPSLGESLGQEDRRQSAPDREPLRAEFFETKVPSLPPSSRIIAQGSQIRAVLLSRIDTRNPGNVIAQVTADTYDSLRAETILIPKGSRLLGSYANTVSPGNAQLAISFSRLMLPDGRAIDLEGMQATGNDGIVGVKGNYHGNFARAIGPAILTAIVGSALDDATRPKEGEGTVSGGLGGGTVQSPTVAQQVVPKITDAVLERYQGAKPYVTAEPGQPMKILVTADLEIPVLETSRR